MKYLLRCIAILTELCTYFLPTDKIYTMYTATITRKTKGCKNKMPAEII